VSDGRVRAWGVRLGAFVAVAACFALVAAVVVRLFTVDVDLVTDTHVWVYTTDGEPVRNATVEVHATGGRGVTVVTDENGRVVVPRQRARRFVMPKDRPVVIPQTITVDGATFDGNARAIQIAFDRRGAPARALRFVHPQDHGRDDDAVASRGAHRIEALAEIEAFLATSNDDAVGARIADAGRRVGMFGCADHPAPYIVHCSVESAEDSYLQVVLVRAARR